MGVFQIYVGVDFISRDKKIFYGKNISLINPDKLKKMGIWFWNKRKGWYIRLKDKLLTDAIPNTKSLLFK